MLIKNLSEKEELIFFLNKVQDYLEDYFGVIGNPDKKKDINFSSEEVHSIKRYKGENAATCFERTAMAHNIFKLFNYKSYFICNNRHAYNLIQTKTDLILFDSTNQTFVTEKGERFRGPTIISIPKHEATKFLYGNQTIRQDGKWVNVVFNNPEKIEVSAYEYPGLNLQRGKEIVLD